MKMLEVAVDSLESAVKAINAGADELELCSFLCDGGLTPSIGLVKEVRKLIRRQPYNCRTKLNVTIRCRGGSDFLYTEQEMNTMLRDVKYFKELNVDGFVFGALTENLDVDEHKAMKVLAIASPKNVTFSRAFDQVREFKRTAHVLVGLGFHRVHSAGLRATVHQPGAIKNLSYLATRYSTSELSIVPCGGITTDNVPCFINMGCHILHATCRKVKEPAVEREFYLGIVHTTYVVDEDLVRELKECIEQAVRERDMEDDEEYQ